MEFDSIIFVRPEVLVYKIPPRTTNRGYKVWWTKKLFFFKFLKFVNC